MVTGTLCIACFFVGAKVGQSVAIGKEIKTPNPVKAIEKHMIDKEQSKEQEEYRTMMENIDKYDGTGIGQKDVG